MVTNSTGGVAIAIIGAGPAGLMAADVLARVPGLEVTLYERMASPARKLLMAGRGGLNLTHAEPLAEFLHRYRAREDELRAAIEAFTPDDLRAFALELGQPTFVGSSGRVFPVAMKASPLLRAWLRRLAGMRVALATRHDWRGWAPDGRLRFMTQAGEKLVAADGVILALGGASWPRLGADGSWVAPLAAQGIAIAPLKPANCGFLVAWSAFFTDRFQGQPLKNIALKFEGRQARGEALVTRAGLEGGAVYALSAELRDALEREGRAVLHIDLAADEAEASLARKLARRRGRQSLSSFLRKAARLSPLEIGLLNETALMAGISLSALDADELARFIKGVPLPLSAPAPLERAISSAGGVDFAELDHRFMLRRRPGVFVAGEMLDWEAPTGGYLLQACVATGAFAARGLIGWLDEAGRPAPLT